MGLIKKNGYDVKGITLNQAYAKINRLYIEKGNSAMAYFGISNTRENLNTNQCLDEIPFECEVDKSQNVYEQIYIKAKEKLFNDFEDDIVTEASEM